MYLLQVDLRRTFKFHNSKGTHQGVPIIASNMDTVGTFEMAAALAKVRKTYRQFLICLIENNFILQFKYVIMIHLFIILMI